MIPKGTYRAVVDGPLQFGKAGKDDKEQVVATFRIVEEGEQSGDTIAWFGYFTEKTWKRTMEALRYCGWKGDDLANPGDLSQEVEIVIAHEEDDKAQLKHVVKWVNRIGGGRIQLKKPMTPDEARQFGAFMKSKARMVPEVAAPAPANGGRPDGHGDGPPPQGDLDDIPFAVAFDDADRLLVDHRIARRAIP